MKTKRHSLICLLLIVSLCFSTSVFANRAIERQDNSSNKAKRIALVIGNSNYKDSPLKNPVNDAGDMAQTLKATGFKVKLLQNASQRDMVKAIRSFGKEIRGGGVGLFYFAGHGIQFQGVNYLIPLKANIETEADIEFEAVDAGRVLVQMEEAGNKINIVILDACRNNPFARSFRSASKGLARMDAPAGSIIAYATSPGSVAADGRGRNGVYTKYLLQHLSNPGVAIEKVFKKVRKSVIKETGKKQTPWESSSLTGEFYFLGSGDSDSGSSSGSTEIVFWQTVAESNDKDQIKSYLLKYPNGIFATVARDKIEQLDRPAPVATGGNNNGGNQALEAAYWQSVTGGELKLVQSYLDKYPHGIFVDLAAMQVEKHLKSSKDLELLTSYVNKSQGRFAEVATQRIEKLLKKSNDWNLLHRYKIASGGRFNATAESRIDALSGSLTVQTTPAGAVVKVLGIKPKYKPGMKLKAGIYNIQVSENGYHTEKYQVTLKAGKNNKLSYQLEKKIVLQVKPPKDKKQYTDPETKMNFVWVPGGCYVMGDGNKDVTNHQVCVNGFYMAKYEVTQAQYQQVMGSNPTKYQIGPTIPVAQVSWEDAQVFIKKLNASSGKSYRLPTEAEWEYGARSGGKRQKYSGGDNIDVVAWYEKNSGNKKHPVGQKQANGLGLYDMSGNVWEWCQDWYGEYKKSPRYNPKGPASSSARVRRGGSYFYSASSARTAARSSGVPGKRYSYLGFRLVLPPGQH